MTLTTKTAAALVSVALTLGLVPALALAESAPSSGWQLRGQARMRPNSRLSDPRTISGAVELLEQAACRRAEVLLQDSKPPRSQVDLVLWRHQGQADETQTGVPRTDCDRKLMRTSAFRLKAWVTYPKHPGRYVRSRRVTVGKAVRVAAKLANRIAPRVLETGEQAWIKIRMRTRDKRVAGMIRGLSRRYRVDAGTALRVARCESGMNPRAYNPPYAGIYQQSTRYWSRRAANYGHRGKSPFDAYVNIDVSLRMARAQGWRHWGCA
jgi:hypothetical protein